MVSSQRQKLTVLVAIADPAIIFSPTRIVGVGEGVRAGNLVVRAKLNAPEAGKE